MLSKIKTKYIRSLEQKKARKSEGVFVAEGPKVVSDLLYTMPAELIVGTKEWHDSFLNDNSHMTESINNMNKAEFIEVSEEELRKVSFLQHPQQVLAIFKQKDISLNSNGIIDERALSLALDGVQDPGNLGTIIRIADWFGIENIYCSQATADVYNPKVVQSTMGSLARVNIIYTDLKELISSLPENYPIYGTFLDGEDLYEQELTPNGLIVMGNEGNGISAELATAINKHILIPNYPKERETADSLNVAVATAVMCAEFRRYKNNGK